MIPDEWGRVAGIKFLESGTAGAVWLAFNRLADTIHVYDACMFKREVMAVIAEGMNARGRSVPVAWEKPTENLKIALVDRGCHMLYDPVEETQEMAEVVSRELWSRMRSGRFRVDKRLAEWLDEFKTYQRKDGLVALQTHPLMSATRFAMMMLSKAKAPAQKNLKRKTYPTIAIV